MATQATEVKGAIDATAGSATTVEVIAAVAGKTLKFSSLYFKCTAATTVVLKSGTTALTGAMTTTTGGEFHYYGGDRLELPAGEALNITTGRALRSLVARATG